MTSAGAAHGDAGPFAHVTRPDLAKLTSEPVPLRHQKSGRIGVVHMEGRSAVLKDYSDGRSWLWRTILGPLALRREVRALRALDGCPPVPRLYCRVDRLAYLMECFEGEHGDSLDPATITPAFFEAVAQAIEDLHAAGWVHCDLKSFGNFVRLPGDRIVILDYATAFPRAGWCGPIRRRLFEQARRLDRLTLAKYKVSLGFDDLLTDEERRHLEHPPWTVRAARCYRNAYRWLRGLTERAADKAER